MARTANFDPLEVARSARAVFWARGYDAAAIPELEAATGLSRSSIYNTFGSKRGLFDAAVQSYLDEIVRPRLQPLEAAEVSADALVTYLSELREVFARVAPNPVANGCLLINTASSPIASDPEVARVISEYRAELVAAFSRGIAARFPSGSDAEVALKADTVTALVISAYAMVRVDQALAINNLDTSLQVVGASEGS